jgi:phage head maturation protease
MPATRSDPAANTLAVDRRALTVRGVITTNAPDREGDIIAPAGLANREQYLLDNPVVLWNHGRGALPPVGTCDWLDVQPNRVVAQTRFAAGLRFAEELFALYDRGVLRGWSIGFVPRRSAPRPGGGVLVQAWDLLEYSAVPVPANPGALTVAIEKGFVTDGRLKRLLRAVPDARPGSGIRVPDALADLLPEPVLVHSE